MKGYIALLCFFTVLLVELTKAQNEKAVLENYQKNPNAVSRRDLENAFQKVCCGKTTGGNIIQLHISTVWHVSNSIFVT